MAKELDCVRFTDDDGVPVIQIDTGEVFEQVRIRLGTATLYDGALQEHEHRWVARGMRRPALSFDTQILYRCETEPPPCREYDTQIVPGIWTAEQLGIKDTIIATAAARAEQERIAAAARQEEE